MRACEFGTFDLARAGTLYNSAAEGGHAGAQLQLAEAHENGEFDLAIDLEAAHTLYQKAVCGGDSYAQCQLAEAYEGGVDDEGLGSGGWRGKGTEVVPEGGGDWQRVCAIPTR